MQVRVQIGGQSYTVEVGDLRARPILATVAGESFAVWPEEGESMATAQSAPSVVPPLSVPSTRAGGATDAKTESLVRAPLPGDIVAVAVVPGAQVAVGQELCTLESMKMKNSVRSVRAGVIKTVFVSVGDRVVHGQPLVEFAA